ncbi:beta-1,3-galactosyltransferase 5-like [Nilaparvata lugens]|uniref:beta-1,3-galactosyltransferase 5-like n=1 Tax=Nilaparvata lugens TaxID=108931 RepID=UPI00193CD3FC|nr:beta-1,3-galactosyltransferase 5-like [Nilaparvata lugens]
MIKTDESQPFGGFAIPKRYKQNFALCVISLWFLGKSWQIIYSLLAEREWHYLDAPMVGSYYHPMNELDLNSTYYMGSVSEIGDRNQLIDLMDFDFLINDAATKLNSSDIFLLAMVHSSPNHVNQRIMIRNSWGEHIKVIFLVGLTNEECQTQLENENLLFQDIVQGRFIDSYENLTYKNVMGLKWITYYRPPSLKYVLKTDDDVMVNTKNLFDFMDVRLSKFGTQRLVVCSLNLHPSVKRTYRSKWRISPKLYSKRYFPNYCKGYAVLYSIDVVILLYRKAQSSFYLWIDDVLVTGILLEKLNITQVDFLAHKSLWELLTP